MRRLPSLIGTVTAAALATLAILPAQAQVTFFATRPAFDLAAPGLPVENFEEARVANGGISTMPSPLDSATNNAIFLTGEILPGLSITTNSNDPIALAIPGAGFGTVPSKSVFGNFFGSPITASFAGGVDAVGLDLYAFQGTGNRTIRIFSSGGEIASTTLFALNAGSFLGFTSTIPVTSVLVEGVSGQTNGLDNIAFGNIASSAAPEPGTVALLGAGLGIAGLLRRRRSRR